MLVSTAFVVSWLLCSAWDRGKWGGGSSAGMSSCVLSAVYSGGKYQGEDWWPVQKDSFWLVKGLM